MTIFEKIASVATTAYSSANKLISKIYGQPVKLGAIVVPEKTKLPAILPEYEVRVKGQEKPIDWTPYLIVGGVILVIVLISK